MTAKANARSNGVPPNDPEAERIVLASMMLDDSIIDDVLGILSPGDFYDARHQSMAESIIRLHGDGNPVEPVSIAQDLDNQGKLQEVGGLEYLNQLLESPYRSAVAPYYAGMVCDASKRRHAIRVFNTTSQDLQDAECTDEILLLARDRIDTLLTNSESPFHFHTATDFDGLDLRRDYHIPGILAAGPIPTVLAGAFKTLKTSVVMDLLISLATQHLFLNHFPVSHRVRVAVMSGESGGFALQNLARRIAQSKGWSFEKIEDWFLICTDVPSLASAPDLQVIERFIVERKIGVLCIDPTYLAMRSLRVDDAGSVFAMGEILEPLSKLGQRTGCTPLIVHHNTRTSMRNNVGEPAELADIAWSGFAEWVGQWLLISRREKYDPDSDGEHCLWLTAGGRDGHSTLVGVNVTEGRTDGSKGRRWEVEVVDAGKTRADAMETAQERKAEQRDSQKQKQADQDRDTILTVMQQIGEPETKTAIRERCGMASRRFNPVFAELLGDEILETSEITKGNGRRYEAYKLQQDATGQTVGPDASRCNRTATGHHPLKGGCPAPAAVLSGTGSSNKDESGRVCPDANCDGNGDDPTEDKQEGSVDAIDFNKLFDDSY